MSKPKKGFSSFMKLKGINLKVQDLEDKKEYICEQYTISKEKLDEEDIIVLGKVLKDLSEIQGFKGGMIRYNTHTLYKVIREVD